MFGIAVALIFYVFIETVRFGEWSRSPLNLFRNNEPMAGAAKLAGYTSLAAAIQMLILWRSPRLGSHGLFAIALFFSSVVVVYGLRSHLYFYDTVDLFLLLTPVLVAVLLVVLSIAAWKKRLHTVPLSLAGKIFALVISTPVLILGFWVVLRNAQYLLA
jgi:hypothetical protein